MAEPTLKDVLAAITRLEKGQSNLEKGQAQIRSEMATKAELIATKAEMNARFDRVDQKLEELDRDLDSHMNVHRELERDVEALKGRPLRTAARVRRSGSKRPSK